MNLILASTSPRRYELLQRLKIPFEAVSPRFVEMETDLPPQNETLFLAEQKALSVAEDHPNSLILASDTLVVCDKEKLGKPNDPHDAIRMLRKLSENTHIVCTAVILLNTQDESIQTHVDVASVTFRQISEQEISDYVASKEPLDKAGAYAIQGGAQKFVIQVDGNIDAVIGLPLEPIKKWLSSLGSGS